MLVHDLIKQLQNKLKTSHLEPHVCQQYAWWLIEKITKDTKTALLLQQHIDLSNQQTEQLERWIDEIIEEHKPIDYILGTIPFGPLMLNIRPPTLIPRPETEEWAFQLATTLLNNTDGNLTILDLCTGSGAIALLLAHYLPKATIYAVDISSQAIALTKENQRLLSINNLKIVQSDLFTNIPAIQFDLIVSNPPYVSEAEYQQLDRSVVDWEDKRALTADHNGLAIIEQIIQQAPDYLKPHQTLSNHGIAQLYIEIGWQQGVEVKEMMEEHEFHSVAVKKDAAGNDRVVCGSIRNVATATH